MIEGLKWQAGFVAICLSLTAFARANDSASLATLAGHLTVSEARQSGQWLQSLESRPSDLKPNSWLMTKASSSARRRGKS